MAVACKLVRSVALVLAVFAAGATARAETPNYKPSIGEAVLTPKFCWHQFMGNKFSGPQFEITHEACGVYVNHYCPGLIDLNRANKAIGDDGRRRAYLLSARENTLYTLRGIKPYPNCPIRAHVEATLRIIDAKLKAFR